MQFVSQPHAAAQIPISVATFLQRIQSNWISIQPGLATLSHHLSNLMGPGFEFTIIEPNSDLAILNTHLCPHATVILSSAVEFFNSVAAESAPSIPKYLRISVRINKDITQLPICSAAFKVRGLDFTVYTHVQLPFTTQLPTESQAALEIIRELARSKGLSYFIILCNTLCTDANAKINVNVLAEHLPLWDISAKIANAATFGDPIAVFRLCISGQLTDEETSPPLSLTSTFTSEIIELSSIIDIHRNHDCFSIASASTASIDFSSVGHS